MTSVLTLPLPMIEIDDVIENGSTILPAQATAYERLATFDLSPDALFHSLLGVAHQLSTAEVFATRYSSECRLGAKIAMYDLLAACRTEV